jgi:hypothetical protein
VTIGLATIIGGFAAVKSQPADAWRAAGVWFLIVAGVVAGAYILFELVRGGIYGIAHLCGDRTRKAAKVAAIAGAKADAERSVAKAIQDFRAQLQEREATQREVGPLKEAIARLVAVYDEGFDIFQRAADDHQMEAPPFAATDEEGTAWEGRVLFLLPSTWRRDFKMSPESPVPHGHPSSPLYRRMQATLGTVSEAILSFRQHLHEIDPDAEVPPGREVP